MEPTLPSTTTRFCSVLFFSFLSLLCFVPKKWRARALARPSTNPNPRHRLSFGTVEVRSTILSSSIPSNASLILRWLLGPCRCRIYLADMSLLLLLRLPKGPPFPGPSTNFSGRCSGTSRIPILKRGKERWVIRFLRFRSLNSADSRRRLAASSGGLHRSGSRRPLQLVFLVLESNLE